MKKELLILHIEDNQFDVDLTQRILKKAGIRFQIDVAQSRTEFIDILKQKSPDIIISDHSLPSFNSTEAYELMKQIRPGTPFILLTGSVSENFAVDCLLSGVDDYILKSNLIRLPSSIERVIAKKEVIQEKEVIENLHSRLKGAFEQIEAKNKEITDSITYAKRIQNAILPNEHEFSSGFPTCRVIFKPRDIVSGDFYWMAKTTTTDGRGLFLKIIAAADCTGHGVPGAFMSLLVSGLLHQTLKNPDINTPGDVLSFLNKKLPVSLNQNLKERITDGLDIALCAFDPDKKIVYFASANRPLWILRENEESSDFQLIEYQGTKAAISDQTPRDQKYETQSIQLQTGDRLFIFSDGITDQFGGIKCKKLGSKGLRSLLLTSASYSFSGQMSFIENFIDEWKSALDQVDDILFIGIVVD